MTSRPVITKSLQSQALNLAECISWLAMYGLVVQSQGNASVYIPEQNLVLIKASGVVCEEAVTSDIVIVDLDSEASFPFEGGYLIAPSTDLASHLHIYREFGNHPDYPIRSIIHTHSINATALAAVGCSIDPVLTGIADCFGDGVPCLPYSKIGTDSIGREVTNYLSMRFVSAFLLAKHGVLTVGEDIEKAFVAAVMVENSAAAYIKAALLAKTFGQPLLGLAPEEVVANRDRYLNNYGKTRGLL